jgi:hypothetical protein
MSNRSSIRLPRFASQQFLNIALRVPLEMNGVLRLAQADGRLGQADSQPALRRFQEVSSLSPISAAPDRPVLELHNLLDTSRGKVLLRRRLQV